MAQKVVYASASVLSSPIINAPAQDIDRILYLPDTAGDKSVDIDQVLAVDFTETFTERHETSISPERADINSFMDISNSPKKLSHAILNPVEQSRLSFHQRILQVGRGKRAVMMMKDGVQNFEPNAGCPHPLLGTSNASQADIDKLILIRQESNSEKTASSYTKRDIDFLIIETEARPANTQEFLKSQESVNKPSKKPYPNLKMLATANSECRVSFVETDGRDLIEYRHATPPNTALPSLQSEFDRKDIDSILSNEAPSSPLTKSKSFSGRGSSDRLFKVKRGRGFTTNQAPKRSFDYLGTEENDFESILKIGESLGQVSLSGGVVEEIVQVRKSRTDITELVEIGTENATISIQNLNQNYEMQQPPVLSSSQNDTHDKKNHVKDVLLSQDIADVCRIGATVENHRSICSVSEKPKETSELGNEVQFDQPRVPRVSIIKSLTSLTTRSARPEREICTTSYVDLQVKEVDIDELIRWGEEFTRKMSANKRSSLKIIS